MEVSAHAVPASGRASTPSATLHARLGGGALFDGRFELEATLAEGAMGTVYRAVDVEAGRRLVALKVLHPEAARNSEMAARFAREARLASKLEHPHCVKVLSFGLTADGSHYLVMELVEGDELRSHLRGALHPARALDILIGLLRALAHCHRNGLVHRDVKPENIMVPKADPDRVVLIDFGVTFGIEASERVALTTRGLIIGTPQYMSPEQASGRPDLDGRCDLYAAGIIFYEMLVGRRPYGGSDVDALLEMQKTARIPALPPTLPRELTRLLQRLVAKSVKRRYASANEALCDAMGIRRRLYGGKSAARLSRRPARWAARRPWVAMASVMAAGLIFGARPHHVGDAGGNGDVSPQARAQRVAQALLRDRLFGSDAPRVAMRGRNPR